MQQLRPPRGAMEPDGTFPVSLLATLADSTLGSAGAVTGRYNFAVTSGCGSSWRDRCRRSRHGLATSSVIQADRDGSLVTAVLSTPDGVPIGFTSMRGLAVRGQEAQARASGPAEAAHHNNASPGENPPSGLDEVLGVGNIKAIDGRARLHAVALAALANGAGRLHGGIVAALAQRAMCDAVRSDVPTGARLDHLVLDVDMVRPVATPDTELIVTAKTLTRTRRFAWADSDVLLPDGRVAARARALMSIGSEFGVPARRLKQLGDSEKFEKVLAHDPSLLRHRQVGDVVEKRLGLVHSLGVGPVRPEEDMLRPEELHQVLDMVLLEGSDPYVGAEGLNGVAPKFVGAPSRSSTRGVGEVPAPTPSPVRPWPPGVGMWSKTLCPISAAMVSKIGRSIWSERISVNGESL